MREIETPLPTYRSDLQQALLLLSSITLSARRRDMTPILVGGAALEVYTGGKIRGANIDVVFPDSGVFHDELTSNGFSMPRGCPFFEHPSTSLTWAHVASQIMDGRACSSKLVCFAAALPVYIIGPEDLLIDRMCQADAGSARSRDEIYILTREISHIENLLDFDYMKRRCQQDGVEFNSLHALLSRF